MIRKIPALQLLARVADGDQNLDKDGGRSLVVVHQVRQVGVVAEPWRREFVRGYSFTIWIGLCNFGLKFMCSAIFVKIPTKSI